MPDDCASGTTPGATTPAARPKFTDRIETARARPCVFFDRDNTLIASAEYLGDPTKVKLIDGAASCIAGCKQMGFAVVTVSNQSGVARGLYSEDDVRAVNRRMDTLLRSAHWAATIDRHRRLHELRKGSPARTGKASRAVCRGCGHQDVCPEMKGEAA